MLLVSLLVVGVIYENGARSMESLRELAAHRGLLIGTSIDDAELGSAAFRDLVARDYGSVTPENAMKWSVTETNRGIEDFLAADRLVNLAVADGQQVRGHTLVWQRQLPGWLFTDGRPPSADELRTLLRGHITNTVARYRGRISSWDVVNEAMGDDGRLRENVFLQVLGPSYIGDAFTWAHAADPSAVLLYNDYGLENGGPKAEAVERLVRGLLDEGIPIGGVGFQAHVSLSTPLDQLVATMDRFAALGLVTPITEADVRINDSADANVLDDQARVYRRLIDACVQARSCPSFTTWGVTDAHSWIPSEYPGQGRALLRDDRLAPKPAYDQVRAALLGPWWR